MVNPDRVRQLLEGLAGHRAELAELAALPDVRYAGRNAIAARYFVQISAQMCIDLAGHVISSERWRIPKDYADAFTVLEERRVITGDLAERMRNLARMRNLLVHAYGEVDDTIVHESLQRNLADLDEFASSIARLLQTNR